ncbi:MAG: HNH endonuclease [Pseudomonas sp.]|nr:HNH endonuclease [Pseudomonas sp.]
MSKVKLKTLSHKLPVKALTKTGLAKAAPQQLNKRRLTGTTLQNKRAELWLAARGKCKACGEVVATSGEYHLDHVVPLHQGGTDADDNLAILCIECHAGKTKAEMQAIGKTWSGKFY